MTTIREITSEIQTDLRTLNVDEWISKRYIYNKLKDKAKTLIKQENTLRLFAQTSLFTTVPCVQLITVPLAECCSVPIPNQEYLQRTLLKLPELYETQYGKYLVKVRDILNTRKYVAVTATEYQNLSLMQDQDPDIRYFWIENNYLYIPNSLVEVIVLEGLFLEPDEAKKLNSCQKVSDLEEQCQGILDQPFICPEYLKSIVKDQTTQVILNSRGRIPEDQVPNGNSNLK